MEQADDRACPQLKLVTEARVPWIWDLGGRDGSCNRVGLG